MNWIFGISGLVVGAVLTAMAMRLVVTRAVRRARVADRKARTAQRLAEIGSMTGGLAHEIKNPLSTIGLNAQLLAEGLEDLEADDAERARLTRRVESLRRETDRLRGILEDFLEYAGELHLDRRPTDLNRAVEELVDFFAPQAGSHGVRIRAELKPGELIAPIDEPHLKQATLNLMLNATQAMDAAGSTRTKELILRTSSGTDEEGAPVVRLHVIDTGPGISAEARVSIFRPYFTTKSGGTGLGLPTCKRIVEAHQGTLDLHTDAAAGTEFTITLPTTVS